MEKKNKNQVFQAEVLEERMEMAKWFARVNREDPRIEVGTRISF